VGDLVPQHDAARRVRQPAGLLRVEHHPLPDRDALGDVDPVGQGGRGDPVDVERRADQLAQLLDRLRHQHRDPPRPVLAPHVGDRGDRAVELGGELVLHVLGRPGVAEHQPAADRERAARPEVP
jgi:hypothetical protein